MHARARYLTGSRLRSAVRAKPASVVSAPFGALGQLRICRVRKLHQRYRVRHGVLAQVLDGHDHVQAHLLQPPQRLPRTLIFLRWQSTHQDRVYRGDVLEWHAHRELAAQLGVQLLRPLQLL